jgi:hypothetical protein
MPSDGPSARWNSNYEAVIILGMEANIIQARQRSAKAKQTFTETWQTKLAES